MKIINFAHRGAAGLYPENTMLAFRRALELGANGIETDVQMTKDGHLILIHDETLTRTTGKSGWVKDLTLKEIQSREAGSWFHEDYRGEPIPTLDQLLELATQNNIVVNLELKNSDVDYPGIEQKTIDAVRKYRLSERVIISSFNHDSLVKCKSIAPDIATGILYMEPLSQPWRYAKAVGAQALHAYKATVTPQLVAQAAESGVVYHPFTVNDPAEMRSLIQAGVAGIITDYPDKLAALLS